LGDILLFDTEVGGGGGWRRRGRRRRRKTGGECLWLCNVDAPVVSLVVSLPLTMHSCSITTTTTTTTTTTDPPLLSSHYKWERALT